MSSKSDSCTAATSVSPALSSRRWSPSKGFANARSSVQNDSEPRPSRGPSENRALNSVSRHLNILLGGLPESEPESKQFSDPMAYLSVCFLSEILKIQLDSPIFYLLDADGARLELIALPGGPTEPLGESLKRRELGAVYRAGCEVTRSDSSGSGLVALSSTR